MKLTPETELCLRQMGFAPEDPEDKTGWWRLPDNWAFQLGAVKNIKTLVKRLMKTEYQRGFENCICEIRYNP